MTRVTGRLVCAGGRVSEREGATTGRRPCQPPCVRPRPGAGGPTLSATPPARARTRTQVLALPELTVFPVCVCLRKNEYLRRCIKKRVCPARKLAFYGNTAFSLLSFTLSSSFIAGSARILAGVQTPFPGARRQPSAQRCVKGLMGSHLSKPGTLSEPPSAPFSGESPN